VSTSLDVRTHRADEKELQITVRLRLFAENSGDRYAGDVQHAGRGHHESFARNLADDVSKLLGEKLETTPGLTLIEARQFDVDLVEPAS
jgi:hypothetical protein